MDKNYSVSISNAEIHLQQRGVEPDIVFVHGFGGDLSTWDDLWALLPTTYPALRYDLRGFGQSVSRSETPFSHTDDLLSLLDALNIEQTNVVGVSQGGAISLNFSLNYPDRVKKLVLISPAMVAWEWSKGWKAKWRSIVEQARSGALDQAKTLWWQHPLFATTRESPASQQLYDAIMSFSGDQWIADHQRPELPEVDRIFQLSMPTLLLTGDRDLEDFKLIADLLEACVPDITRIAFPDNGHMLHLEVPGACVDHIVRFLANT